MRNTALAILRVVVGLVFMVHGWNKFMVGFDAVSESFGKMGIPVPMPAAVTVAIVELLCGLALILGLYVRLTSLPLMVVMIVAIFVTHLPNGFFVGNSGYEYTLVLLTCLVVFALTGGGRPALDQVVGGRNRSSSPSEKGQG